MNRKTVKIGKGLKDWLPSRLRRCLASGLFGLSQEVRLIRAFVSDYLRYRKYSFRSDRKCHGQHNLDAMIILEAHCIEKAFSLPDIRPGYGSTTIPKIINLLQQYRECGYDPKGLAIQKAQSVLAAYMRYHEEIGYDLGMLKEEISPWANMECGIGGYINFSRDQLIRNARGDFKSCALSRFSVRSYAPTPITEDQIREVIDIARKTPSVCNRQSWHTYVIKDRLLKMSVLELQNGNRGFGALADFLIIITTDIASFVGSGERNESYIDGGLYAMSILYALHYKGIGACPLNWMVDPPADRKLRKLLGIKPSENIIMIITAGALPESVRVAKSVRREVADMLTIMDDRCGDLLL